MNTYDSYKDSGVEWIGRIPNSWRKLKIKHLFSHTKGKNGQKLTKEFIGNNPGEYPVYSGTTKGEGHLGRTNEYEFDTYGEEVIFVSTVGSDTTVMSTKVLKGRFNLSQNCLIMTPKFDFSTKYQYYFTTHDFPYQRTILPIVLKEGHRSVGMGELNEFTSLLPPLSEQQQIVEFLDTKTELIDSLIEKTERKIELLKEKRTSLINDTVTKGLNPNVEMKDSGVEWIGEIPSHWKKKRVKYLIEDYGGIKIGPFGSSLKLDTLTEDGIKVYGQGNVIKDDFTLGHRHIPIERFESDFTQYEIYEGDVLITMMGTTGRSKVFKKSYKRGILDSHLLRLRFKKNSFISELFVTILQESDYVFNQLKLTSKGSIMEGLNSSIVKQLTLMTPPISEQQQIVEYMDEQTGLIDKTISNEEKRKELLKKYRQSLISEVVTGKRKVTN